MMHYWFHKFIFGSIKPRKNRGVLLIDVLFAIGMSAILGLAIFTFQRTVFSGARDFMDSLNSQGEMRRAFKDILPELRSASQSSAGAYPIASASSTQIIFYSDIDENGSKERLRYFLATSTLWKGIVYGTGTPVTYPTSTERISSLVKYVVYSTTSPIFSYYDRSYTGTSSALAQPVDPSVVRLIKMTVTVDKNANALPPPYTGTSQVVVRNLKDNL